MQEFDVLWDVICKLRDKENGCPWDLKQSHKSLVPNFIEELYEVIEAIDNDDFVHLKEELGDLLLHILMQTRIASESDRFSLNDVLEAITAKLISRHPHIFDDNKKCNSDAEQVKINWERIKFDEKKQTRKSILDGIPKSMPALIYAQRMQEKAASVGFDWKDKIDVLDKLKEETDELIEAVNDRNPEDIKEEIGDLLFTMVNFCRKAGLDSEMVLKQASDKFYNRFNRIEEHFKQNETNIYDSNLEELDDLWQTSKKDI